MVGPGQGPYISIFDKHNSFLHTKGNIENKWWENKKGAAMAERS